MTSEGKGTIRMTVCNGKGPVKLTLSNVLYIPKLHANLMSATRINKSQHRIVIDVDCIVRVETADGIVIAIARNIGEVYSILELQDASQHGQVC